MERAAATPAERFGQGLTICSGPFSRWGKPAPDNPTFPAGGYMTEVDVYLDTVWAATHPDYRFDFTSAINNRPAAT